MKRIIVLAISAALTLPALAQSISAEQNDTMKQLIAIYADKVKAIAAATKTSTGQPAKAEEFSAENGRQIYLKSRNWEGEEQAACATCHTDDPKNTGKHAISKKSIYPLAPVANIHRFTSVDKVETNFSLHCHELYNRDCTAAEKGHILTYLLSVK
jgi:mono/diheme cytochrome c family protein